MFNPDEAKTRKELIDPALHKAGWDVNNRDLVGLEIPVDGSDPQAWAARKTELAHVRESGAPYKKMELPTGISDYVLYRSNGEILAIVEAKRTSIDPRLAQTQAEFYVSELEKRQSFRPFAFMANGRDIYFLDAGSAHKRPVAGFFSRADLENLLFIRQNKLPLSKAPINTNIVNRIYQQEAIRRVCETFEQQNKRKALLVMATGTGKTRTVMALIDLFLRTNQARQVLFVADRDALVQQAITDDFEKFLQEPCERIYTDKINQTSRLYAVTLQSLNLCFQSFTPAFFDLIIFDEAHRSIFNKWNEALQYFDGRIIGLTATPADFIDRSTFLTFDCNDKQPTYLYSYKQAVADGYLVDYTLYRATTHFQRQGIKGVDLSEEERNALYEQGLDPDNIDFAGTDLEKKVSNKDTLRKQWQEIWDRCYMDESGQIPGKTIIFAMTQEHALRIEETFNEMFPQYPNMTRVITHKSDHKGSLIKQFKHEEYPRIAITVDLLETGIDIPEVVNLVFMKPVQSRIKLEQMIGRGTRSQEACHYPHRLPNREKKNFLIIDFWENNFEKTASEELRQSLPVFVALFNTRLDLLEQYLQSGQHDAERGQIIARLREQIARIPTDSLSVKKFANDLEQVQQDFFWRALTGDKMLLLRRTIGPLLRYVPAVNVEINTFTHKVERLKLQLLTGRESQATALSIRDDVSRLPNFIVEDQRYRPAIDLCLSLQQLQAAPPEKLDQVIDHLAGQMDKKRDKANTFIKLDLSDYIAEHGYIFLKGGSERVYVEEYKRRVDAHILQLIDSHPTLDAIAHNEEVSDEQLLDLERTLHKELGQGEDELTEEHIRMAYGVKVGSLIEFIRTLLALDGIPDYNDIVRRQFEKYADSHPFNADQLRFLGVLQNFFLQRRHVRKVDLYQGTFASFGMNAVDRLFSSEQIEEIIEFANSLAA